MTRLRATLLLALTALGPFAAVSSRAAERPLDFNRDIRPILSDRCFACHGPDDHERKAGLRLDDRAQAIRPAKSGATAIVPGKPEQSQLLERLTTHDQDDIMPPPRTGKTVTPEQVELIRGWILQGAPYREHWSFLPPERPAIPPLAPHPVDALVRKRLADEKLDLATEADRTTLIRRVTLDLTGLPPTPEELDAYLADPSPKAYERVVDRLLASPRYGERMAVEWLDAARYADTHGYHLDSGRDMSAWRDGVIRAFNENKRYDQFTIEQLAGDLLPSSSVEQKIASGFNRNHMINYEGGAIPEEYHYAYLVDRVNTTATVWLGLAMACAQCHDHKYDPLSQNDYYRFLAFFNNVPESGLDGNRGNAKPVLSLPSPEQRRRLADLDAAVSAATQRLDNSLPEIDAAGAAWEDSARTPRRPDWTPVSLSDSKSTGGASFRRLEDGSTLVHGEIPPQDTYVLSFENPLPKATAIRLEAFADPSLKQNGPGRSENGNFVLSTAFIADASAPRLFRHATADFSQNGFPIAHAIDDKPETGWAIHGATGKNHAAVFEFAEELGQGTLHLTLRFLSTHAGHSIGRFRIAVTDSPTPHPSEVIPDEVAKLVSLPAASRTPEQQTRIRNYYREKVSPEFRKLREALAAAKKERDELDRQIPSSMVMAEMDKPRDTFVRIRGAYDRLGNKVAAGTPAALPALPTGEPENRLGLARWLTSPRHPLTARVTVNRYWQLFFGNGLVRTTEDFGSQGEWPSHPELLDWLAREFVDSGWNVKALHRLLVTSSTYRQTAKADPELFRRDPDNRWLGRGPRFRLQAEFVRDQALAVSGLLNPLIGGKSVSPYQPPGLWEELSMREDSKNFSAQFFVQSKGPDLYRRSMYTFWKRSSPPPQMSTFDAPDRETCTVRRPRTNTPLQALILLNDPTYVEASRKLAERILNRSGSDADRIAWAFRLATARTPAAKELEILQRVLDGQRAHYRKNPPAARLLATIGESPSDPSCDPAELAAWTILANSIFNLDETVTRG